jgi:hypothetical protein
MEIAGVALLVVLGLGLMIAGFMLLLFSIFDVSLNDNWEERDVPAPGYGYYKSKSESHWDRCPRGMLGGKEEHERQGLSHRIVNGKVHCIFDELAEIWDNQLRP